jgi:hydroxymethylbilane synthase
MADAAPLLRIGTRGSPLAMAQAHETQRRLAAALGEPPERFAIVVVAVTGDQIQDRALSEAGGKGLFTKEIDEAQLAGRVDIAVHSGKDLPTTLPDGLIEAGFLERENPRDALITRGPRTLDDLPAGSVVGTASLRRQALVRRLRPDLKVVLLRGNVQTRLSKLENGTVDATILAMAGLNRLGLADRATAVLDPDVFLPAVAQGAIGLVTRAGDPLSAAAVAAIAHAETGRCVAAERAFLGVLDGSCKTPIAGHARITGADLSLSGLVLRPDGSEAIAGAAAGAEPIALGRGLGEALKARLPAGFFAA